MKCDNKFSGTWHSYVISLSNTYRNEKLKFQLNSLGIEDTWIEAVDLRRKSQNELENDDEIRTLFSFREFTERHGRHVRPGELGCLLSHRLALKCFLESNNDRVLILEDDAEIEGTELLDVLHTIESILSTEEPVLLTLFTWGSLIGLNEKTIINIEGMRYHIVKPYSTPYSTVAYALNRNAARVLIEDTYLIDTTADWPNSIHKLNFLYCTNCAISTSILNSQIRPQWSHIDSLQKVSFMKVTRSEFKSLRRSGLNLCTSLSIALANSFIRIVDKFQFKGINESGRRLIIIPRFFPNRLKIEKDHNS